MTLSIEEDGEALLLLLELLLLPLLLLLLLEEVLFERLIRTIRSSRASFSGSIAGVDEDVDKNEDGEVLVKALGFVLE